MKKNILAFLVPIVLVVGTAFGAGLVFGDETAESDVEVGVDYVAPEITIDDPDETDDFDWKEDVEIKATVEAPGQDNVFSSVTFVFEYIGELPGGDAETYVHEEELDIDDEWDEGEAEVSYTFDLEDDSDKEMWRHGDWEVVAEVYDEKEELADTDEVEVFVNEHLSVDADDAETVEDVPPGETAEEFVVPETDDDPMIEITANSNWELTFEDGVAVHTEEDSYDIDIEGEYEEDSGYPIYDEEYEIYYEAWIPYGHLDGTYSTDHEDGTSVTHLLEKLEIPDEFQDWTGEEGEYSFAQYLFLTNYELEDPFTLEIYVEEDGDPFTGEITEYDHESDEFIWVTNHLGDFDETPQNSYGAYVELDFDENGNAEIVFGNGYDVDVNYGDMDVNAETETLEIDFSIIDEDDLSIEDMSIVYE